MQIMSALLNLLFRSGFTLRVAGTAAEKQVLIENDTTLNENKAYISSDEIAHALQNVVATNHAIYRGKVVGIASLNFKNFETVKVADIACLDPSEVSYVAWDLIQEHAHDTQTELLEYLTEMQSRMEEMRSLSAEFLSQLITKWKYRMVWSSNAIEGSKYTLNETVAAIEHKVTAGGKSIEDAVNAVDGAESVEFLRTLVAYSDSDLIITEDQLLRMHAIVLKHTLHPSVPLGKYRDVAIYVTGSTYEFPPATNVPHLMGDFLAWLNSAERRTDFHPVALAVAAHLRFVTIHPFVDGNGRMSRLLMNLVLMKRGYAPVCILPSCRAEYMGAVKIYQQKGNGRDLLMMVANEMLAALEDLLGER